MSARNAWNTFQHQNKGKFTHEELVKAYRQKAGASPKRKSPARKSPGRKSPVRSRGRVSPNRGKKCIATKMVHSPAVGHKVERCAEFGAKRGRPAQKSPRRSPRKSPVRSPRRAY
jgi:hypothetical protein